VRGAKGRGGGERGMGRGGGGLGLCDRIGEKGGARIKETMSGGQGGGGG